MSSLVDSLAASSGLLYGIGITNALASWTLAGVVHDEEVRFGSSTTRAFVVYLLSTLLLYAALGVGISSIAARDWAIDPGWMMFSMGIGVAAYSSGFFMRSRGTAGSRS